MIRTSRNMREDPLFVRNTYQSVGKWGVPLVKNQNLSLDNIGLIACSDTRANDNAVNRRNGVHFFVDDYRFKSIYDNPERSLDRYAQYAFLLTPDYSLYADFNLWQQIENVGKNRWVGAYWQSKGLRVIPTISWSTPQSFEFCFDGVEKNATVAVSTVGCRRSKREFMRGYDAMLTKLQPRSIICYGDTFPEMEGNVISVSYWESRKVVR